MAARRWELRSISVKNEHTALSYTPLHKRSSRNEIYMWLVFDGRGKLLIYEVNKIIPKKLASI